MDEKTVKESAKEYVELELDATVLDLEVVNSFEHFGSTSYVLSVTTSDEEQPEWWVVAGETATNLYPKSQFDNPDYVFSFHQGIMSRMADRRFQNSDKPPEDEKYDAFVSYSSNDQEFVEPLVRELKRNGHWIWYDEDELEVGDSIRESIDEGLSRAHAGVVILSDSFFEKGWTRRELNGLTSRGVGSDASVILPVWYKITKEDVMEHSPPLADKKAVRTDGEDVERVAEVLSRAISSTVRDRSNNFG